MRQSDEEIFITVITGTLLTISLIVIIIIAVIKYQKRLRRHLMEVRNLEFNYQQEVLKAQLEMQEQTFLSISQEIHDNIGQILSLVRLNLSKIKPDDFTATEQKIISSKELLDQVIADLRDLSKRLSSKFVSQNSLAESLRFQLNMIQRTELYETKIEVIGIEKNLDPEKKLIIFRIAQEVLNNIIKHAEARNISVLLCFSPDQIKLSIEDDGIGFEMDRVSGEKEPLKGIGLQNMFYRANLIGAQFSLHSVPGSGTKAALALSLTS
jgi:two-component system, NarL family, sensor kinase